MTSMLSNKLRSLTPTSRRRKLKIVEDLQNPRSNPHFPSVNFEDTPAVPPVVADRRRGRRPVTDDVEYRPESSSRDEPVMSGDESPEIRTNSQQSNDSYETDATSIFTLPALQAKGLYEYGDALEPVLEDDPRSFDLVSPPTDQKTDQYSLESRAEDIFSVNHLHKIFNDSKLLLKFTTFLGRHRPQSIPLLVYYLDALKAISAVNYANAVAEALEPLEGHEFTKTITPNTRNELLEERAQKAFEAIAREDLPAYVNHTWTNIVSDSIKRRINGTLPPHLREASEGLAEVFCLSDPSRPDNPIAFASEEFHRTTQYGVNYAIGRNCRFLQGPRTNPDSVRRLREAIQGGKEVCETFVNYRRDGSPFMNLLMVAPLRDSRGTLRYFIGAQVDVSGLAKECTGLDGAQKLVEVSEGGDADEVRKDEFQELSTMFNQTELEIVRKHGGAMHREHLEDEEETSNPWHRPRLLLHDSSSDDGRTNTESTRKPDMALQNRVHGRLRGCYEHYLLVRPYPSLRILFASPSLRVPGILQSPFMDRIGSSERVHEELITALSEGRGVTAKVKWVSRHEDEGRNRWIHCTPLYGSSGSIGVWMIVIVDDENSKTVRRFREAPPVATSIHSKGQRITGTSTPTRSHHRRESADDASVRLDDPGDKRPSTSDDLHGRIPIGNDINGNGSRLESLLRTRDMLRTKSPALDEYVRTGPLGKTTRT